MLELMLSPNHQNDGIMCPCGKAWQKKERGKEKQEQRKGKTGDRECRDRVRARWERDMFALDKPFIAHTKESKAVIDNCLDSIYLISPK